jgi:hypothetical protein
MNTSIYLLSCALTLAQPRTIDKADWQLTPQLAPGLELIYRGEYLDDDLAPHVQRQRKYRLDTTVLVLEAGVKDWQVGMITALTLQDAREADKKAGGLTSMRLEFGKIELQGRLRHMDNKLMPIPIKGPATIEGGFVLPVPLVKVGRNHAWDVGEEDRPTTRWQVVGAESVGGLTCVKIAGVQQTPDWEKPRADQVAWRRRDTIWLHPQLNVAQRVERIIERRDPARDAPTERMTVRYDLESHLQYPGASFNERRQEMHKAVKLFEETQSLTRQPAQNAVPITIMLKRVGMDLDRPQGSPYRKVFAHLKMVLENAQKGEVPVPHAVEEPGVVPSRAVVLGQRMHDFAVSSLTQEQVTHYKGQQGKPVLVFFYNPATQLGKDVITYAKKLSDNKKQPITLMAMAVTQDTELVRRQHEEMKLAFPILDGNGLRLTFDAAQTPRFVLIDAEGMVRFTQTGWGFQTPYEIDAVLERCRKK